MELLVLVIGLVALDVLAMRVGCDSRDGFGALDQSAGAPLMGWSDSTYDHELAHETRNARQYRPGRIQVEETPLHQADDLMQVA